MMPARVVLLVLLAAQPQGEVVDLEARVVAIEGEVLQLSAEVVTLDGDRELFTVEAAPEAVEVRLAGDVFFAPGEAGLTPEAVALLDGLVPRLREEAAGSVTIEGHTDAVDDDAYNQDLSERRAESVRAHLAGPGGLGDLDYQARGFGESQPIAPNANDDGSDNPQGRALNRRVTIRYEPR